MISYEELFDKVEALQNLLVAHATGDPEKTKSTNNSEPSCWRNRSYEIDSHASCLWAGATLAWRPHTRLEAQSPRWWRVQRTVGVSSATEQSCCALVPSYAKGGLRLEGSPGRDRLGRGAAHVPGCAYRRWGRSQSRGLSNGSGSGIHGLGVHGRSETPSQ